jgi:cyd operon protein YbgT
MWYLCWVLGLGFAVCFGVLNALWCDLAEHRRAGGLSPPLESTPRIRADATAATPSPPGS